MKKILAAILVVCLCFGLYACGDSDSSSSGDGSRCNNCGGDGWDSANSCSCVWCGGDGRTSWNPWLRYTMAKKILLILLVCLLLVVCIAGCDSSNSYPAGYEACFRCNGAGLINDGFIDFKTCPTCRGSGMLDSHWLIIHMVLPSLLWGGHFLWVDKFRFSRQCRRTPPHHRVPKSSRILICPVSLRLQIAIYRAVG